MKQALPKLSEELSKHAGYSLLIVGYSLGTILLKPSIPFFFADINHDRCWVGSSVHGGS